MTITISYINWRWPRARKLIEGVPVVVITDGEPVIDSMRKDRLSIDDLMTAAREEGIRRFSDVELAVLGANGRISFFTRSADNDGAAERSPAGTGVSGEAGHRVDPGGAGLTEFDHGKDRT